jgi:hypothetical protein
VWLDPPFSGVSRRRRVSVRARLTSIPVTPPSTRLRLVVLAVAALLVLTTSVIVAATPSNPGPFTGCLSAKGVRGLLYNVAVSETTPAAACAAGDTQITFSNAQGPQGIQGPQGLEGLQGPQGIQGPPGPAGQDGADGQDGAPGEPGQNGQDGEQGPAGEPGADGQDGTNGTDGSSVRISQTAVDASECPSGTGHAFEIVDGVTGQVVENSRVVVCDGMAGADGEDGAPGQDGAPGSTVCTRAGGWYPPVTGEVRIRETDGAMSCFAPRLTVTVHGQDGRTNNPPYYSVATAETPEGLCSGLGVVVSCSTLVTAGSEVHIRGGHIFYIDGVQQPSGSFWQGCDSVNPFDTCNITIPDHDVEVHLY